MNEEAKKEVYKRYYIGKMPIGSSYTPGIRLWNNGFPVKVDTYRSCTNACHYCYARGQSAAMIERSGVRYNERICRYMTSAVIQQLYNKMKNPNGWMGWAMRGKYFIEAGTMAELFQEVDVDVRSTWNFLQMCRIYKNPLLINTKGNLLCHNEDYFNLLATHTAPVVMNISLTTIDDETARRYEPFAPLATERLKLIRRLRDYKIPSVIYLAPFMPGVSDVDVDRLVKTCMDYGAVGIHIRNFYITGKLLQQRQWKNYRSTIAKDKFARHGVGYSVKSEYMLEAYNAMNEIANKVDPRFKIAGMKTRWFETEPNHGKIMMDGLPQKFKDGIIDFTALPILRKIREKQGEPQVLYWDSIGYKEDKINHPNTVYIGGDEESSWLSSSCAASTGSMSTSSVETLVDGFKWIKMGMWNGTRVPGYMSTVGKIYPVVEGDELFKDEFGDLVYSYIPDTYEEALVRSIPMPYKKGGLKVVDLKSTQDMLKPEREGGVEDKFRKMKKGDWYDDFE